MRGGCLVVVLLLVYCRSEKPWRRPNLSPEIGFRLRVLSSDLNIYHHCGIYLSVSYWVDGDEYYSLCQR